jgi:hypothetical protein
MVARVLQGVDSFALLLAGAVTLGGCASLESVSSGQVGCAEQDITISNDEGGLGTRTWVATCHGKRFFCSAVAGGNGASQVSCKEEVVEGREKQPGDRGEVVRRPKPSPPAESADSGCQFDTQCKGDRICDHGECVAPPSRTPERAPVDAPAPATAE